MIDRCCMNESFIQYFRCPSTFACFKPLPGDNTTPKPRGFFQFGPEIVGYGTFSKASADATFQLYDASQLVQVTDEACCFPFNPSEVTNNLRLERYITQDNPSLAKRIIRQLYYILRPAFPVAFRRHLQRLWLKDWNQLPFPKWPVDTSVDRIFKRMMFYALQLRKEAEIPFIWFWPDGHTSCAIMTHDVETSFGLDFIEVLMNINDSFSIKGSFQLIPAARYTVTPRTLNSIQQRGFEANVHDLKHDGHLYDDRASFKEAAAKINDFARQFGSVGFRSGALYRNQDWYEEFQFAYDMSVPNIGHLDPQHGGCCTVMPYFVGSMLEIPVTMTQDYTLFSVFNQYSLNLWRKQLEIVMKQHGLASFIVHPDYIQTEKTLDVYKQLLAYLAELRVGKGLWIPLPREVNTWWRQRNEMTLVWKDNQWQIEGTGSERASVAYARLEGDTVTYSVR